MPILSTSRITTQGHACSLCTDFTSLFAQGRNLPSYNVGHQLCGLPKSCLHQCTEVPSLRCINHMKPELRHWVPHCVTFSSVLLRFASGGQSCPMDPHCPPFSMLCREHDLSLGAAPLLPILSVCSLRPSPGI